MANKLQVDYKTIRITIDAGTTRNLTASWDFSGKINGVERTESYEWQWKYYANGYWYGPEEGTTKHPFKTATYQAKEEAKKVAFRVKPVSKTYTSDKKEVNYFDGAWSSDKNSKSGWVEFSAWEKAPNPPSFHTGDGTPSVEIRAKEARPYARGTIEITKKHYNNFLLYIEGFEILWQAYDGHDWVDLSPHESGIKKPNGDRIAGDLVYTSGTTIALTDNDKANVREGTTLTLYTDAYIQATYTHVRLQITPIPNNEYAFLPATKTKRVRTKLKPRKLSSDAISITTMTGGAEDFYAYWETDDTTWIDVNTAHIQGFEVQWEYQNDANIWNSSGGVAGLQWLTGESETVDVSSYKKYEVSPGNVKKKKIPHYQWVYGFSLPDGVPKDREVRLRIKIKDDGTASFKEEWSDWITASMTVPPRSIEAIDITYDQSSGNKRKLTGSVKLADFDPTGVSAITFSWYYATAYGGGTWLSGTSSDVNLTATSWGTLTPEQIYEEAQDPTSAASIKWQTQYTAPAEAKSVMLEVVPIPDVASRFKGRPLVLVNDIDIPTVSVQDVEISVFDANAKSLRATWNAPADKQIANFECRWEYYYLDSWHDGQTNQVTNTVMDHVGGSTTVSVRESIYTVPENAKSVRFTVRPVSTSEDVFIGVWCNFVEKAISPSVVMPSASDITTAVTATDDRVLYARYLLAKAKAPTDDIETVTFEWSYYRNIFGDDNPIWVVDKTDQLSIDSPLSEYTVPDNAEIVMVKVKYDIDNLEYKGEFSPGVEFPVEKDIITPEITNVTMFELSTRTIVADWTFPDSSENVADYTTQWQYYKNGRWMPNAGGSTVEREFPMDFYDAPENVPQVRFRVMANPKNSLIFPADQYSEWETYDVPEDTVPEIPDAPTATVLTDGYTISVATTNTDYRTASIEYDIYDITDDSHSYEVIPLVAERAVYRFTGIAGHIYQVRIAALNSLGEKRPSEDNSNPGGWSPYTDTISVRPAPTAITSLKALNATSIQIDWEARTGATEYIVEYTTKRVYFDQNPSGVSSQSIESGTTFLLDNIDKSDEYFFRVAVKQGDDSDIQSEWSEIKSVVVGRLPTAPTTWSNRANASIGDDIYLYWTHNAEDGGSELEATIEITINGVAQTPVVVPRPEDETVQRSYKLPDSMTRDEATIEWSVMTKGVVGYSPASTRRFIRIYTKPSVQIGLYSTSELTLDGYDLPSGNLYEQPANKTVLADSVLEYFPLRLDVNAYPLSQIPVAYIISVVSNTSYEGTDELGNVSYVLAGQEIYKKYYNTDRSAFTTFLMPSHINVENGASYTINVSVAMDSGLTAQSSARFMVSWDEDDFGLNAELSIDRDRLLCHITPFCIDDAGSYKSNVTMAVYRREFDGGFTLIAKNLSNDDRATVTDPHPALNYARYRIVGISDLTGRVAYHDVPGIPINEPIIVIQWDEKWEPYYGTPNEDSLYDRPWTGSMIKLPYNIDTSDSNTIDVEMVEYIGRSHPVSYFGTQVGQQATWNTVIPMDDVQTIFDLRRLAKYMGNVYVREPSGTGYWAHVEVSFSMTHRETTIPVGLKITRVEGGA